ncbi:hypothetical protein OA2633_04446 [Oceanicaulis sp. HTCC2633]|nr:hypothetical protein OA2633_04446 [Oceanicaulis sp. HTCC2633]
MKLNFLQEKKLVLVLWLEFQVWEQRQS